MATVSPSWNHALRLPRDPRSPGVGRATLRAVLGAHGLGRYIPVAESAATEWRVAVWDRGRTVARGRGLAGWQVVVGRPRGR